MDNFQPILRILWTISSEFTAFSKREIPGYRHTQVAEIHFGRLLVKGEIQQYSNTLLTKGEKKERDLGTGKSQSYQWYMRYNPVEKGKRLVWMAHWYNNPYGKREKGTDTPSHYTVGTQGPDRQQADRPWQASRDPHLAGRDPHLLGHQPTHQGE